MKKNIIHICICSFLILTMITTIFYIQSQNNSSHTYACASWATSYDNIPELANSSDIIAVVKVLGENNSYYYNPGLPVTEFNVEVSTAIKGGYEGEIFTILQTGIRSEGNTVEIEDDPLLNIGNEYLIFGYNNDMGSVTIQGGPQGRFVYNDGKVTSLYLSRQMPNLKSNEVKIAGVSEGILLNNVDIETVIADITDLSN